MERAITVKELEKSAAALRESKFSNGEQILFCVDYGLCISANIYRRLFSTVDKALTFAQTFGEKDYVDIYPVFDIWNNPKQVDC